MRVLVTGAAGYVGTHLCAALEVEANTVIRHDIDIDSWHHDIVNPGWIHLAMQEKPDMIYHLAANKYAMDGEQYPAAVARTNIEGTYHAATVAKLLDIPMVLASTCKAADPMTAYGASKLIAERITRNAKKHVFRFVNILDSVGSVLRIWKDIPKHKPLPITDCTRMWMTTDDAIQALLEVPTHQPGVYGPASYESGTIFELAEKYHPGRETRTIDLRLGDRPDERLFAEYELRHTVSPRLVEITNSW